MYVFEDSPAFQADVKRLTKKYRLSASFLPKLIQTVKDLPIEPSATVRLRIIQEYELIKRRVKNPARPKGKSGGFRLWYFIRNDNLYPVWLEDVTDKSKEWNTDQHVKEATDRLRFFTQTGRRW